MPKTAKPRPGNRKPTAPSAVNWSDWIRAPEIPVSREVQPPVPLERPETGSLQDEIARVAYSYWENRNGEGGSAEEDWLRAEEEVLRRVSRTRGKLVPIAEGRKGDAQVTGEMELPPASRQ